MAIRLATVAAGAVVLYFAVASYAPIKRALGYPSLADLQWQEIKAQVEENNRFVCRLYREWQVAIIRAERKDATRTPASDLVIMSLEKRCNLDGTPMPEED